MREPRVFTIPAGAPFLATFTRALADGTLLADAGLPFDLGAAKIYVPTRRAARALRQSLAAHYAPRGVLLPRIVPLGAIDEDAEGPLFSGDEEHSGLDAALAPAAGETQRRLILMRLILGWARGLRHAVLSTGPDGAPLPGGPEPLLVGATLGGVVFALLTGYRLWRSSAMSGHRRVE